VARAEGTVNIEVKGALQGALEVRTLEKAITKLDKQGQRLSSGARSIQSFSQSITTSGVKTRKVFDSIDKGVKMMGTALTKGLMLALKSTLLQFGLFSAALMGIHALFIAGKWLHKAYSWGMTAIAGAAASAAIAIGVVTAAVREQQAAMHAYTAGGAGEYITNTNQVRVAMRTLQADAHLAGLGADALNKAYAAMAKSMKSSQIAQSGGMIKNLMDFGAAGQDPAAAADKVGALIEALNNSKTSMAGVNQAAKALGPQMEKALKAAKVTSKKQMKELIMSGELAKAGGVAGQFEAVNSTLMGQAKSFFNLLKVEFGDFGQQFLEPAKVAMQKIFRIIRTDLVRVSGALSDFGDESFFDGIVSGVDKVSNFFVKFIREWLPKTDGFFKNMNGGWERFSRFFKTSREQLRPFIEGARAIEGIFKPILSALKSGFLDSFKDFNEGAISNKETFAEIGENLGSLITELFRLQEVFTKAFSDALPFLSDVIKGVTQVVGMMTSLLSKFSSILGGPMAYMALLILGRQMKGNTGGFLGKERTPVNTMSVIARSVIVNGGGPGGPGGPGSPGGPGGPPAGPGRPGGPGGPPAGPPVAPTGGVRPIPGNPPIAQPTGPSPQRLSTGAGAGAGGGGGMAGPGGPGTAPTGAGSPGTQGASSRPGFWGRIAAGSRQQAQGNTGLGDDLFRGKITGRRFASLEQDAAGEYTGRVMNRPKFDPATGQMISKQGATYDPQTGFVSTKGQTVANKIKYSGMTTRSIRNSGLGSAILGNDAKGIGGINRSMGAKMGVGMGMGVASQFMPEEAQGAMAMGAMVGQFNPLAGLAVGLGGAALNSKTAGGGALTGAGAGAAIGTMIAPGIGTAVGAALGAITGAIAGFAGGIRQRAKESKEAMNSFLDGIATSEIMNTKDAVLRQAADAAQGVDMTGREGAQEGVAGKITARYTQLTNELAARKFDGSHKTGWDEGSFDIMSEKRNLKKDQQIIKDIMKNPAFKGLITPEQKAAIDKDPEAGIEQLAKDLPERLKAATAISTQQGHRMKLLKDMSGKSGAEIEVLAKKMGVNLYDATLKTSEIVEKLGLTMVKTAKEMKEANIDLSIDAISTGFDEIIRRVQAPDIYDERGTALGDTVRGGGDTVSVLNALKSFQESSIGLDPSGSAVTDFYNQKAQIGTLANPGILFQEGGAWADIDPSEFFTPEVTQALTKTATETEKGLVSTATTQIQGQLGDLGRYGNTSKMNEVIAGMTDANRERFLTDVESGVFSVKDPFKDMTDEQAKALYTSKGAKSKAHYQGMLLNEEFAKYGVTDPGLIVRSQDNKKTNAVAKTMKGASETFKQAVKDFNLQIKAAFGPEADKPEWWSKEAMADIMKDDTSTPRGGIVGDTTSSRLSQTMDRHNAVNSSVAGKRTITSSYRTTGLGSLNSDHVTGRAIDIVGQNLGSYAVATRNAGGFAEFHGSGDRRHLHAVPGPGAIGDTLTPSSNQMSTPTTATVASGGSSFTFHINGGQNNPEEIANMVMAKIRTTEQRIRERT
jgi:hypothetical protein